MRSRGLYYCQYLTGIGHLIRSLHICRCLIETYDIDFLLGGHDVGLTIDSPYFHLISLPPIEANTKDLEEIFQSRRAFFHRLQGPYDFFITEMFPFSKWEVKEEIEELIKQVRQQNPHALIACSLRDSFQEPPPKQQEEVVAFILQYYDRIFVHADQRVFQLKESFGLADQILEKISYTGFITHPETDLSSKKRQKRIVVSIGAGSFGLELVEAVIKVASRWPDYQFELVQGPKTPPAILQALKELAKTEAAQNIHFVPFLSNLPEYLAESALSINLGGYTIIDTVFSKTPALVYPTHFFDQYVRALKFNAFGFIKIITQKELVPERLSAAIEEALKMPPPLMEMDMLGAQTTYRMIKEYK